MSDTAPHAHTPDPEPDDDAEVPAPEPASAWPALSAEDRRSYEVRTTLRNLLIRHVLDELGPSGVTYAPEPGLETFGDRPQPDPQAAVRAARQLQWTATGLLGQHIDRARGRGVSWHDLAAPLGITGDADAEGIAPAEAAFHLATTGRIDGDGPHQVWGRDPYRSWRCAACREWVRDRGPFNGHPDDDETGHAAGCTRHAADVAAWRTRNGWADDADDDEDDDDQDRDDGDGDS
jgi:hypothetical protein